MVGTHDYQASIFKSTFCCLPSDHVLHLLICHGKRFEFGDFIIFVC